jgi:hypothetical protein
MARTRKLLALVPGTWLVAVLVAGVACGDDDDAASGAGSAARMSCERQCEAQDRVQGCRPPVDLATCKQLCGALVAQVDADCGDEFSAYYDCSANQGFECLALGVGQDALPCKNAQDQLDACQGTPACVGADDEGLCPRVTCPCPEGATSVSGFSSDSGECRCYDERTCVDFFCD